MKNQNGVTLVTMIVMVIVIAIIASVSIMGGVSVLREAKGNVAEENLATVKAVVSREAAKASTGGVLTPANATFYGIENARLEGIRYDVTGNPEQVIQNIGDDWYLLDEDALEEMGVEYANEEYVVNYKLNVVIPLSSVENIHEQIEMYNNQ